MFFFFRRAIHTKLGLLLVAALFSNNIADVIVINATMCLNNE